MMSKLTLNCAYLQLLMKQKGLSNKALGSAIGVSGVQVSKWRNGRNGISARNLIKLANALQVDKHALIEGDDQKAQMFLRQTIIASIEQEVQPVDIPTMIQIMRTLGMISAPTQTVELVQSKGVDPTKSESQVLGLLKHGKLQDREGYDNPHTEPDS